MFILDFDIYKNSFCIADEHLTTIMRNYINLLKLGQDLGNIILRKKRNIQYISSIYDSIKTDGKWVLDNIDNWYFVYGAVQSIYKEHQLRFNSNNILPIYKRSLILNPSPIYLHTGEIKTSDIIDKSRQFYINNKEKLTWTKRKKPIWL